MISSRLLDAFYSTGRLPQKGVQLPFQSNRHLLQSALIVLAAIGIGFTSTGLAILPLYLLIPAIIGYAHIAHYTYSHS